MKTGRTVPEDNQFPRYAGTRLGRCATAAIVLVCLVVLAAMFSAAPVTGAEAKSTTFRVLTYNIRTGLGSRNPGLNPYKARKGPHSVARVISAIRSTKADVVALQEVLGRAQARRIARGLGMHMAYIRHGVRKPKYGYWWGLAVLSRYPIARYRRAPISTGRRNTRSNLIARIRIGGRAVTFVNTHKDKDGTSGSAIQRTVASVAKTSGPVVILGDLNIRPSDRRLRILNARFTDSAMLVSDPAAKGVRRHPTHHRNGRPVPGKRIDYIYVDKRSVSVKAVGLLAKRHWHASDHIGVSAVLSLK